MVDEEYEELKLDILEQIKEFTTRLNRMTQGDVTVESKISSLKVVCNLVSILFCSLFYPNPLQIHDNYSIHFSQKLRQAIAESFNTIEMIRTFGEQSSSEYAGQLDDLENNYLAKQISLAEYETKKVDLLKKLSEGGYSLSTNDKMFLEQKADAEIMENMRRVDDDE